MAPGCTRGQTGPCNQPLGVIVSPQIDRLFRATPNCGVPLSQMPFEPTKGVQMYGGPVPDEGHVNGLRTGGWSRRSTRWDARYAGSADSRTLARRASPP